VRVFVNIFGGDIQACFDAEGEDYSAFLSRLPAHLSLEDKMHNLAHYLIMQTRPYAHDHESLLPEHDGRHFYGAAFLKTSKGRYFVAPNMPLSHDHTDRDCAETNVLAQYLERKQEGELPEALWFAGGNGNFKANPPIAFYPDQEGARSAPCAKCLHALLDLNPDMQIHMLPLYEPDPDRLLSSFEGTVEKMAPREVLSMGIRSLFRYEPVVLETFEERHKAVTAFRYLADYQDRTRYEVADEMKLLEYGEDDSATAKNEILINVNRIMMQLAARHYQAVAGDVKRLDVSILRTESGQYYAGLHAVDHTTSSPPSAAQSVYNTKIDEPFGPVSDIFYLTLNIPQLKALAEKNTQVLDMFPPPGSALMRVQKFAAQKPGGGLERKFEGLKIWMFKPNNVENFDPEKDIVSKRMNDIMPVPFANPKRARNIPGSALSGAVPSP